MKKNGSKGKLLFPVLFLFFLQACSGQTRLPGSWQPGMVLKITYGGGMRYYSSDMEIKETGSYRLINEEGKEKKEALSFTKQELDELAVFLKNTKMDLLQSKKRNGIIYDMGTTSITITWDKNVHTVSVGATEEIAETDRANYSAIQSYISKLTGNK